MAEPTPPPEPMTFEAWLAELDAEAKRRGYRSNSHSQETGTACWLGYYHDGTSPAVALTEDEQ